jgi:hypothetical protein
LKKFPALGKRGGMLTFSSRLDSVWSWFFDFESPFWRRYLLGLLLAWASLVLPWTTYGLLLQDGVLSRFQAEVASYGPSLSPQATYPFVDPDGSKWAMLVEKAFREGSWRISDSPVDAISAKTGSTPVYWASGYFLYLSALTGIFMLFGVGFSSALMAALFVSGPLLLWAFSFLFVFFALRAVRGPWGLFLFPLLFVDPRIESAFSPVFPDHHGLIFCAISLWVLSFFSGGTYPRLISGIFLGFSLWLSTLTTIPIVGIFSLGALLSCAAGQPWVRDPREFRLWAWTGAGVGLLLWVLDYVPLRAAMRLEVLHPLWCLTLAGGGEILCRASLWLEGKRQPGFGSHFGPGLGWLVALLLVLFTPFAIVYSSGGWFWVSFPWVSNMMTIIIELQPFPVMALLFWAGMLLPALCLGFCLLLGRSRAGAFCLVGLLAFCLLAFQGRWLALAVFLAFFGFLWSLPELVRVWGTPHREGVTRLSAFLLLVIFFATALPSLVQHVNTYKERAFVFDSKGIFGRSVNYAVVGGFLREDSGGKPFVVLGPADVGTTAAYYGGGTSVGSIYWEAWQGLKDATEFWGSEGDLDGQRIVNLYGINYVVFSPGFKTTFLRGGTETGFPTLFERLEAGKVPDWMEPLKVKIPGDPGMKIYRVVPWGNKPKS